MKIKIPSDFSIIFNYFTLVENAGLIWKTEENEIQIQRKFFSYAYGD
jgi:hypothetical protein